MARNKQTERGIVSNIERYEPEDVGAAIETLDRVRAYLAQAEDVEDVALIRDKGEAMAYWARERDMGHETEMIGQEIARRAERKLGELYAELREAGKVRKAGRPRKSVTTETDNGESVTTETGLSAMTIFDSTKERAAANAFASIDEDTFAEAMAEARKRGDVSRNGVVRVLREQGVISSGAGSNDEFTDPSPIGRIMPKLLRVVTGAADQLSEIDASSIEHEDRKEWKATLREQVQRLDAWQKAIPR